VEDATYQAGAKEVAIIEEPVAAAIGAGIDISKACGNMIVDIGGGTTDIAVISLGGPVVSTSIKVAGDDFDEALVRYMRKKHNLLIGERTGEDIKIQIGAAFKKAGNADHGSSRTESCHRPSENDCRHFGRNAGSASGTGSADCGCSSRRFGTDTAGTGSGYL
jgi:actin-like ATPase involved in cell morphogenesis